MAARRMLGLVFDVGGLAALSNPARKVWCRSRQASFREDSLRPDERQEFLWQDFFACPTQWWDNRKSKRTIRCPDFRHRVSKVLLWLNNRHKPAWVDSKLATWDAGMKTPSESLPSSVEWQGAFGTLGTHQGYLEVGICRKLVEVGRTSDAVDALNHLVQQGCHVPNNLFYHALKMCTAQKDLPMGRRLHALTIQSGYEGDAFLATHLMGLYASHGRLEEAMQVFSKVCTPSTYNWTSIIHAYGTHGEAAQVICLFRQMVESITVKITDHIYVAVLTACATAKDLVAGKEVHAHLLANPGKPNIFVHNGLVSMYAKCGSLGDARKVFDRLAERDVVTWNALIAGYAQHGMGQEALSLYSTMQQEGFATPNSVTYMCLLQACASVGVGALQKGVQLHAEIEQQGLLEDLVLGGSLVNMYTKCDSLGDACRVFDRLPERDVVAWNAMLAGYVQHRMSQDALSLYTSMQQEGVTPNSVTFLCILQVAASAAALPLGKQLHTQIEERGLQSDLAVGTALVNMYAKCGSMFDSQQVFDSLPERTIEAWGALIGGYTRQGNSEVVFDLVDRMRLEGIQPNDITFLCVLTVCSHVGEVNKGRKYFEAMKLDYGISPTIEHYTCMVDLLGRAGHLDAALHMAKTMPFPADIAVWLILLGACRKWKNVEIGRHAFDFAVSVDGNNPGSYVVMSSIYASAQMWEEAKEMQARRVKSGAWKKPGQSWWTDMGGVVHTFVVGSKQHIEGQGWNSSSPK